MTRRKRPSSVSRPRLRAARARADRESGARRPSPGVYGIGVDVLRVQRIEKVYARHGERFVERLLHPEELKAFARAAKPAVFLAKAFAVKEAFVKALGTGFRDVAHDDVGSRRDGLGKPTLVYSPKLERILKRLKIRAAHVSLSDEGGIVAAMAVLER